MANQFPQLTRVFQALADPTRFAVIERLSQGPASTSELALPFKMALPSFLQHLDFLQECGLISSSKKGRVRTYGLALTALKVAEDWLASQRSMWQCRLDQLDNFLHEMKETSE